MNFLTQTFESLYTMPLEQAIGWAALGNLLMFLFALGLGEALVRGNRSRQIGASAPPITRDEIVLSLSCLLLNIAVAIIGLVLWRGGVIHLRPNSLLNMLIDCLLLIALMDLGMYVFHRVAHHRWLFPIIHRTHHRFENPRPLTLFVLNPFEVLGFGALLIVAIALSQASQAGILLYLAFNLTFGMVGHLGVEIAPRRWLEWPVIRFISTSTFHAEHHHDPFHNYGFYTVLWDRLFGTLSPDYAQDFRQAVGKSL